MKIKFSFLLFLCLAYFRPWAQQLQWAHTFGDSNDQQTLSIKKDAVGDIYVCGIFKGVMDADPGPGTANVSSNGNYDIFIQKLDSNGNFIWVKSMGGSGWDNAYSIYSDNYGHVFITGDFTGTVDFDPGPAVQNITSNGSADAFILQLDSLGNLDWVISLGGANADYGTGITVGNSGYVYAYGTFSDTIDTDPGVGTNNLTGGGSYVIKYDTAGVVLWAKSFNAIAVSKKIISDSAENILLTGGFFGTKDFDPNVGVTNLTAVTSSGDICLQKIDSSGNFLWAKSIAADQGLGYSGMAIDSNQNIIIGGDFNLSGDFDPGPGVFTLNPVSGSYDMFICKFNSSGNFIWAKSISGMGTDAAMAVSCDNLGSIYVTGIYNNTVDFDPNAGIYSLTAPLINYCFVEKLDANGNFIWAGSIGNGHGKCIEVDSHYNLITGGWIGYAADFDLGPGIYADTSAGNGDAFVFKLSQDICSNMAIITDSINDLSCQDSGHIAIHAINSFTPYSYSWNTVPSMNDSAISVPIPGIYSVMVTDTVGCQRSLAYVINGPAGISFFDLQASLVAGNFMPGFTTTVLGDGSNLACIPVSGIFTIVPDSLTSYSGGLPLPDSVSGDTLFWNFSALNYDSAHITPIINVTTSPSAQIGDTVCFEVFISPTAGDADTTNNYKKYCFPVVNGYDPNDISVYPQGVCPQNYVVNDQKLTYTIRFQNTGNSNAININVLDSLDSDLDLNSVRVIANSHPLITEVLPGNVLKFGFDNIMLPDSGSNEPASHGYVIYEVDPLPSLANGTQIKNQADIYFDFNVPVITNEVMNTIIDSLPNCWITTSVTNSFENNSEIKVYPNPAKDVLYVEGVEAGAVITIYDCSGRIVITQKTTHGKTLINTSNLQSGIYLIDACKKSGKSFNKISIQ